MANDNTKISVNLGQLMVSMQTHDYLDSHYLDITTGDILVTVDGIVAGQEMDIDDLLDEEPDRYRLIEPVSSSVAYQVMEDFVDHLPHGVAQTVLRHAIEKSKPFRQFKDALAELGEVRDQWSEFELKAYQRFAEKWLSIEGIEATLSLQSKVESEV